MKNEHDNTGLLDFYPRAGGSVISMGGDVEIDGRRRCCHPPLPGSGLGIGY